MSALLVSLQRSENYLLRNFGHSNSSCASPHRQQHSSLSSILVNLRTWLHLSLAWQFDPPLCAALFPRANLLLLPIVGLEVPSVACACDSKKPFGSLKAAVSVKPVDVVSSLYSSSPHAYKSNGAEVQIYVQGRVARFPLTFYSVGFGVIYNPLTSTSILLRC